MVCVNSEAAGALTEWRERYQGCPRTSNSFLGESTLELDLAWFFEYDTRIENWKSTFTF